MLLMLKETKSAAWKSHSWPSSCINRLGWHKLRLSEEVGDILPNLHYALTSELGKFRACSCTELHAQSCCIHWGSAVGAAGRIQHSGSWGKEMCVMGQSHEA